MSDISANGNDYRVNLEVFEGPMDLLLYLIKKNDIDICDIPIAFILEEYLRYLDTLKEMNIDLAGEFLLLAAELAYIKSRMLLPSEGGEEEAPEEDPRADLVRRLLEYQQYKEAAQALLNRPQLYRDVFTPFRPGDENIEGLERQEPPLKESDVYRLVDAFARILVRLPKEKFHDVAVDRISVNDRILQIVETVRQGQVVRIEDLLDKPVTRYGVVITFLALLEMSRLKMIELFQPDYESVLCIKVVMEKIEEHEGLRLIKSEAGTEQS